MLRTATDADIDAILRWRNQEPNRRASITSHEITPAEHAAWWARVKHDPSKRILVYERDGEPIGVANFFDLMLDPPPRRGGWGFFFDNDALERRGQTLPAWVEIMQEGLAYAFDELGLDELHAEVLADNVGVLQMNRRFGFVDAAAQPREVDGRALMVVPIVLHRSASRHRPSPAQRPPSSSI